MSTLKAIFLFFLSPLMSTDSLTLSLGRILMASHTTFMMHLIASGTALGMGQLSVLAMVFLVLASYCFGDKPQVRELISAISSRVGGAPGAEKETTPELLPESEAK